MICVSIARGRHRQMMAEHRHLVEQGAQLVELRIDYIRRDISLKRLLADRPSPVIITCRREADGGKWTGSEEARMMLLRSAIAEGVEYVDLEHDIAGDIPRYGKTKRIISMHDFDSTPLDLPRIHARLAALDADIVKIATMAQTPADNVRMLRLVRDSEIPTIGICMGEMGIPTRLLAGRFGSPFTYATFHHERTLAPGQLSYRQMTDVYNYDAITRKTEVYGVVADPIGHSLSPIVHNAAFRRLASDRVYIPFRIPREQLEDFMLNCEELGVRGLSITIPHKENVLRYIGRADEAVQGIGAANTVLFENGQVVGHNTDAQAAIESLVAVLPSEPGELPFHFKTALILGAGGVARAVGYALRRAGADVVFAARELSKAEELAGRLEGRAVAWHARGTVKASVLVNATPVGMHPNVDETPFERRHLRPATIVFDTVYNPEQTLFIKQARQVGCAVVTGVDMFVRQAALQFQLFTGTEAPVDVMRDEVRRAIGPYGRG